MVATAYQEVTPDLARRLKSETQGDVLFGEDARARYATDASIYQIIPAGVFVPKSDQDVVAAIGVAKDLNVPVVPRGAGTSQCGQAIGEGLIIDNSKYRRRILDVNVSNRIACVEPGLVLDDLNAALKKHALWFPVDVSTSAQATLGGMAGNNSCGSRSIRYGNMVHNVTAINAWLSDGAELTFGPTTDLHGRSAEIASFVRDLASENRDAMRKYWPKVMRRVAGYNLDIFDNQSERPYTTDNSVNLAHLLVGSEGTLGFTKTITLKLEPLPRAKVLGVVNFPNFQASMSAAQHIVKLAPSAVELVDRLIIETSLSNPVFRPVIETALIGRPDAILLVEFSGEQKDALVKQLDALVELMGDLGLPGSVIKMVDNDSQKNLWEIRKAGLNILMSLKGDGKPVSFIEDCAVPLEHLADYTSALTEVFSRHGTHGTWYAHASVGTLHVRPILDMRVDGARKMRAIAEEAGELVRKYKGAFSGEHGDGICRGEWIAWQFGPDITAAFDAIKKKLDPIELFNPRMIVAPPRMDEKELFRFPPRDASHPYKVIDFTPVLDWSEWDVQNDPVSGKISAPGTGGDTAHGFSKAAEMCNNNGACRKFDAGTMCPSYRVTLDEQHSTRGRANTLRMALSNQIGPNALTGQALYETMDLCVSCKGCRRECPTGVDMAKMKIEFLHAYKAENGFTFKDRLIAHLPDYAAFVSRFAGLANLRNRFFWLAQLSEKFIGFSAKRSLPWWRSDTFWKTPETTLFSAREDILAAASRGEKVVCLFVDTFSANFEPENAFAAARIFKKAGYQICLLNKVRGHHCCGRTFLAVGMVEKAKSKLLDMIEDIFPLAEAGIPLVGLEPSCLLTLRDEALVMGLGTEARLVASQALLFEEFLYREIKAGRFKITFKPAERPILVHGHCHQKAFGAVAPIMQILRTIPGAEVELIESSCCGMAGSFGYDVNHHNTSMRMAELGLLPSVRRRPEAIVVADGTSCRHQILDGSGRTAIHVAVLLDLLARSQ